MSKNKIAPWITEKDADHEFFFAGLRRLAMQHGSSQKLLTKLGCQPSHPSAWKTRVKPTVRQLIAFAAADLHNWPNEEMLEVARRWLKACNRPEPPRLSILLEQTVTGVHAGGLLAPSSSTYASDFSIMHDELNYLIEIYDALDTHALSIDKIIKLLVHRRKYTAPY